MNEPDESHREESGREESAPAAPLNKPQPLNKPTPRRRMGVLKRIALFFGSLYVTMVLLMMLMENSLIFFPTVYPKGVWTPSGLEFEDAWFTAADGTQLHGWYVPYEHPRAVLLFAHGNAGNISHRVDLLEQLHELGVATLAFDYRGYGRSSGEPSAAGILADARAARQWLAQKTGVSESHIVLMGESLGGGVMVDLAAHEGARGLILESTFTSLPDVAAYHYPWLPVRMLMRTRMDSAAKIGNYHGPLLQLHGDADTVIPYAIGQRLFSAANDPKTFVTIPAGDHNDPRSLAAVRAIDAFLESLEP